MVVLKNLPYRISLGYNYNNGIVKTSNFQRFTASVNLAPSFFDDHLKVNVTAKYMNGKNRYADTGAAIGGALSMDPTRPVYGGDSMYDVFGGYYQNAQAIRFLRSDWRYTSQQEHSPESGGRTGTEGRQGQQQ